MTGSIPSSPIPEDRTTDSRCGYTIVDSEGVEQPCDRPATGWRWYQDVEHEDALDVACSLHENEGGRRLAAVEREAAEAKAENERLRADNQRISDAWAEVIQREQRTNNAAFFDINEANAERDEARSQLADTQAQLDSLSLRVETAVLDAARNSGPGHNEVRAACVNAVRAALKEAQGV